jgi:hypothetical protein
VTGYDAEAQYQAYLARLSPAERQFVKYADWWADQQDADPDDIQDADIGADVNAWINVVRRARLDRTTKYLALLLATYASPDGTNIYPGVSRLAIQSGYSSRMVELALHRLRAVGLIQLMPRRGLRRGWSSCYRLILSPDLLNKVDVPTPATEDAQVEQLTIRRRGKHRKKTARNPDCAQIDDCAQWDGATARNGQAADQQEARRTLHVPLPKPNPPFAESGVVARGTGSARARAGDGKPGFGSNQAEDKRRAELAKLEAWMKENTA